MLQNLPLEVLFNIASFLSCKDISLLRLASKRMRAFCDHPINWRSIKLEHENPNYLWRLSDLKEILSPHVSHIHSIHIWGVRDSIIHYLLSQCKNLRHLKVCGWTTLSDHSFKLSLMQPLKLRSLELVDAPHQANYISLDAYTLGGLILQSPEMKNLLFGCDINIHADTLLTELEKAAPSEATHLQSFTLATRRTWTDEHVLRFVRLYPTIRQICLMSMGNKETQLKPQGHEEALDSWITENLTQVEFIRSSTADSPYSLISTKNMIMYNTNLLYV